MQPEKECEKSSKQKKLKQHVAACWSHCQEARAPHNCPEVSAIAKQTFYPAATVTVKLPPAPVSPNHGQKSIKRHRDYICSNFLCKHASPASRADIVSPLSFACLPGENFGLSSQMPFASIHRATKLGVGFTGHQHPVYEDGKVIFDNAVFPAGSRAAYVRLMTVNCEEYRKALVGNTQKNKFSKLMGGT